MSEYDVRRWLEHERDVKRQVALLNSKHKTLRNLAHILADIGYEQIRNASDTRNIENTKINDTRNELLREGITIEEMNKYETPALLPEGKRPLAYRVLDRHT